MPFNSDGYRPAGGPKSRPALKKKKPSVSGKVELIRVPGPESMPKGTAQMRVKPKQSAPPGNFSKASPERIKPKQAKPPGNFAAPAREKVYKEDPASTSKRIMKKAGPSPYERQLMNSRAKGSSSEAVNRYLKKKGR